MTNGIQITALSSIFWAHFLCVFTTTYLLAKIALDIRPKISLFWTCIYVVFSFVAQLGSLIFRVQTGTGKCDKRPA